MGGSGNYSSVGKVKKSLERTNDIDTGSKYAKQHRETVNWVKEQIGVDLNKYRDGDGSRPSMTTYWDRDGVKVAVYTKGMPKTELNELKHLTVKYNGKLQMEEGSAWFHYLYLKHQFK